MRKWSLYALTVLFAIEIMYIVYSLVKFSTINSFSSIELVISLLIFAYLWVINKQFN